MRRLLGTLQDAKTFMGTVQYKGNHFSVGDVISYVYDECVAIVDGIKAAHVQGDLRLRTKLSDTMLEATECRIRLTCPYGRGDNKEVNQTAGAEHQTHVCPNCQKKLSSAGSLTRHVLTHQEQKIHTCEKCLKAFTLIQGLARHVATCKGKTNTKQSVKSLTKTNRKKKKTKHIVNEKLERINETRTITRHAGAQLCQFAININWTIVKGDGQGRSGWVVGAVERTHSGHFARQQIVQHLSQATRADLGRQMNCGVSATQVAFLNQAQDDLIIPNSILRGLKQAYKTKQRAGLEAVAKLVLDLRTLGAEGKLKYALKFSAAVPANGESLDLDVDFKEHVSVQEYSQLGTLHNAEYRYLLAAAWERTEFCEKAARFPEVMSGDATSGLNNEGRPVFKIQGRCFSDTPRETEIERQMETQRESQRERHGD